MTEHRKRDVQLANLAFDTVIKVREEGRQKHPEDDGDDKSTGFQLMRGDDHCMNAVNPLETEVRMHIEHMLTRATMALLKYEEE